MNKRRQTIKMIILNIRAANLNKFFSSLPSISLNEKLLIFAHLLESLFVANFFFFFPSHSYNLFGSKSLRGGRKLLLLFLLTQAAKGERFCRKNFRRDDQSISQQHTNTHTRILPKSYIVIQRTKKKNR